MISNIKTINPVNRKSNINKKVRLKDRISSNDIKLKRLPKVLMISTYPPRQCGIATYTQDLKNALDNKYENCFETKIYVRNKLISSPCYC